MKKSCFFLFAAFLALSGCSDSADDNEVLDKDEPPVEFNGSQIFYTTIDDSKLSPNSSDFAVFGSNLLSNTYEDGQGVWTFEGTVSRIGENAFKECGCLESIVITDVVVEIGEDAFEGCVNLKEVSLGNGVTNIGQGAFSYCTSLSEIVLPDALASIGDFAFLQCRSLQHASLGSGVTHIGLGAFSDCLNLSDIILPDGLTVIGNLAFSRCMNLTNIAIPDGIAEMGVGVFIECQNLTTFEGKFASADGRCIVMDGVLKSFAPHELSAYTVPDGVAVIGSGVFFNCSLLESVVLPEDVTVIEESAFYDCI